MQPLIIYFTNLMNFKRLSKFSKITQFQIRGTFKQLLNQNDQYANFIVTDVHKSRDFQTIAYTLRHLPSQANYTHFATNIIHNQGALLFKTPPADDSGVAHVVQQVICCGSQKYPVRDAWTHMHGRSLQPADMSPYLMPDFMVFQFQSALYPDFYNLLALTIEQVFNPLFREVDFLHQVRLQILGNETLARGAVFEQMKQNFEQPEFLHAQALRKHLLSGTPYEFTAGGKPEQLATLTFEACRRFYETHITADNSYFVTAGDMDVLQHCQFLDKLLCSQKEWRKGILSNYGKLSNDFEKRLHLKGGSSFSFAFRGADLTEDPQDYFRLGVLSYLLHEVEGTALRALLDEQGMYCYNYGCETSLKNQIFSIGFQRKDSEQGLFQLLAKLRSDFHSVVPKDLCRSALDRIKLRRSIQIQDLFQFIIHSVKPQNYLTQNFEVEEFPALVDKYFRDDQKCTVNMEYDQYYVEDYNSQLQKYLNCLQVDIKQLAEHQTKVDEDNSVISLESLPKIHAQDIIPLIKEEPKDGIFRLPKYPQQCNIEWHIDISDFGPEDTESVFLIKDLLPEIFNRKQSTFDLEARVVDQKLILEVSCLDKHANKIFQEFQLISDPPLDDYELLSTAIAILSSNYLNYDDLSLLAASYCQQQKYTTTDLARRFCNIQVESLKNYSSKSTLDALQAQLIRCFFKLMNRARQTFLCFTNPFLKEKLVAQLDLISTNLRLQFEDYDMNPVEFVQKYEIQGYERPFKYLKTFVTVSSTTNSVAESIKMEHHEKRATYLILASLLSSLYLPQYCTSQKALCQYLDAGVMTFSTSNDVHTLKSFRVFENSVHLLNEYLDQDALSSAKLRCFTLDAELMKEVLAVSEQDVKMAADWILKRMAEGETAQVIFGQSGNYEELVKRGWTVERYVNDVSV